MKTKDFIFTFISVLSLSFVLSSVAFCDAEKKEAAKKEEKDKKIVISKTTTGAVSYIDSRYISVMYETDKKENVEYEIGFHLDGNVQLNRVKNINQLKRGDTVELTYDEVQEESEAKGKDGTVQREMKILERHPRAITFVRPAKPELSS